jgi:hypothetical protein
VPSKYFEPLQLSLESKNPRLMDISLDAFHYMMGKDKYFKISLFSLFHSHSIHFILNQNTDTFAEAGLVLKTSKSILVELNQKSRINLEL